MIITFELENESSKRMGGGVKRKAYDTHDYSLVRSGTALHIRQRKGRKRVVPDGMMYNRSLRVGE